MRLALLPPLLLLVAISIAIPIAAAQVPLAWRDSGVDLAAGRRYTIALESHCLWGVGCAKAIVQAGPFLKIVQDGSRLKVWLEGDLVYDEDTGSEANTITIVVDWGGSGTIVLPDGSRHGFSLDRSYRIMVFTERVCAGVGPLQSCQRSRVTISFQSLPHSGPTSTELQPIDESPRPSGAALLLGAGVVGVGALAALALRRR